MKLSTKAGRSRLSGWGQSDNYDQWLEILGDTAHNSAITQNDLLFIPQYMLIFKFIIHLLF